jgi:hypothetical protein
MTDLRPLPLDEEERRALDQFVRFIDEAGLAVSTVVEECHRGPDGRIIVPVGVDAEQPSLSLALFMEHKGNQLYKHTACRCVLAQRPMKSPDKPLFYWSGTDWQLLP